MWFNLRRSATIRPPQVLTTPMATTAKPSQTGPENFFGIWAEGESKFGTGDVYFAKF